MDQARKIIAAIPMAEILGMYKKAADYFVNAKLPCGDTELDFDGYVRNLSATTGSPSAHWACSRPGARVVASISNTSAPSSATDRVRTTSHIDVVKALMRVSPQESDSSPLWFCPQLKSAPAAPWMALAWSAGRFSMSSAALPTLVTT